MIKIDQKIALCFGRLRHSEFAPLMDYLKAQYEETLDRLVTANPEIVRDLQGKAKILKELISYIEKNDELIAKLKAGNPNR